MKNGKAKTATNPKGAGRPHNPPTANAEAKARFLALYPECGTITLAAKQALIPNRTIYSWIDSDPEFAKAVDAIRPVAKDVYVGTLEEEARRRAVEGVEEPVFYKGALVEQVRKYSDLLLIFLLKGAAPEKYREHHEISGPGGGPVILKVVEDGNSCA